MDAELVDRLLAVPMHTSNSVDVYSGVARMSGRIWAREVRQAGVYPTTAVVLVHPTSNFMGHYLLEYLAAAGLAAIGMCTRYVGNDSALLLENCVLDVGSTVRHLRDEGYERIVLVGNSGGGGLVPLYQAQAHKPTIVGAPGGQGPDLTSAGLSPADAVVLLNAHPSRAILRTEWLDPAIRDESAPFDRDADLDMFLPDNGPPYSEDFLRRYRQAQVERARRISAWCWSQLQQVRERFNGRLGDWPFTVHGTTADPRFLDLGLDSNDRQAGRTLWGAPDVANYLPTSLGHFTTLRSWLSQWSLDDTNAGPHHMANVAVPVLILYGTADPTVLPSHVRMFEDAMTHKDWRRVDLEGGTHYFDGQTSLRRDAVGHLVQWLDEMS